MKKFNIGVLGATGIVGQEMLEVLIERDFPIQNLYAFASKDSEGKIITLSNDKKLKVNTLEKVDTSKLDILLSSAGAKVSEKYLPNIAEKGTIVIDNTSYFRTDSLIPLIIPEINADSIVEYKNKNIIANPNCSTIIMLLALAPLHKYAGIKRVNVATYQAVSGVGNKALDELFEQTKGIYAGQSVFDTKKIFTKQIAFNVIPHIDIFLDNGYTKEEWKMDFETKKILDSSINVNATCVRVPVFIGHSMVVTVDLDDSLSVEKAKELWSNAKGVCVVDYLQDEGYVTPVEVAGEDKVYISRIRKDISNSNSLTFWVTGDNIRKGAALNAVQIAELLINKNII